MDAVTIVIILIVVVFGLYYLYQSGSGDIMPPEVAKEQIAEKSGVIIDVRTPSEYSGGHLEKVRHNIDVTSGDFEERIDSLDKDKSYFLYCQSGRRSGKAKKIMERHGFEDVHNIGGFGSLVNAGFKEN